MNFEQAMTFARGGRVVRRKDWTGHVRCEGICLLRVQPGKRPTSYYASPGDKTALDWETSQPPARSHVMPEDGGLPPPQREFKDTFSGESVVMEHWFKGE